MNMLRTPQFVPMDETPTPVAKENECVEYNPKGRPCVIFDLDGVIADTTHRDYFLQQVPKAWDAFYGAMHWDRPIQYMASVAKMIRPHAIALAVTGRPEKYRTVTVNWLRTIAMTEFDALYMRRNDDMRPPALYKRRVLEKFIFPSHLTPVLAFDDDPRVCEMYESRAIPVLSPFRRRTVDPEK